MVNKITTTELRQGKINGGIIFQGCAEPHEDWVNGVRKSGNPAHLALCLPRCEAAPGNPSPQARPFRYEW